MKKTVVFLLTVIFALCGFACNKADGNGGSGEAENKNAVVISGFESLPELKTFMYANEFNKAEVNTDKQYVTEGSASAKFTLRGTSTGDKPKFNLWLDTRYANGKNDFSNVQALTVDVFSLSETERKLDLSIMTRKSGATRAPYVSKSFTLKKGYNRLIYAIDRAVAKDVCYIDNAEYITFEFENSYAEPYVVYVDNLVAHTTNDAPATVEKQYKENELLFFDDYSDRFAISVNTLRGQASEAPTISICRDPRYIQSGNGSLQLKLAVTPNRQGMDDYPGVAITGNAVERIDFSQYSGVSFSVMGDAPVIPNVSVEFWDENDVHYNGICHLQQIYEWKQPVPGFKWHTMTADVKTMENSGVNMSKITKICIYYNNQQKGEPFSLYFDDFTLIP